MHAEHLASRPVTVGDGYWLPSDLTDDQRNSAAERGCTHVAILNPEGRASEILDIDLMPVAGGSPLQLRLPREHPWLDPRRWGWFVVAPVLDAVTIVAIPPIALFLIISNAVGYAC